MKILLVDDEKFAIEGLRDMLDWDSFHGVLAGTASNGKEALESIDSLNPDVIISDIKMPVLDGIGLAKAVFSLYPHIKIVLLSGHSEFEYARSALRYGVMDYVLKPITRDKLHQLESLLLTIFEEKRTKKEQVLTAWDSELSNVILQKLKQADKQYFDDFFQSKRFHQLLSQDSDNYAGLQLINYLFLYFSDIKINGEAVSRSKKMALNDYLELNNAAEKMDFIITKYCDVLISMDQKSYTNADSLVTMALKYTETHFSDKNFNISALADELNISISHLSTIFKQSTGSNLSSYLAALRVSRAKDLLSDIHYPISDVALMSGYEDPKYFAKLFKKKTGYSPSEYRNLTISGGAGLSWKGADYGN